MAISSNWRSDHCGRGRNLLLGHRQVCSRRPIGEPSQIAGGARLLRRDCATPAARTPPAIDPPRTLRQTAGSIAI